jgi:hypothetical protein
MCIIVNFLVFVTCLFINMINHNIVLYRLIVQWIVAIIVLFLFIRQTPPPPSQTIKLYVNPRIPPWPRSLPLHHKEEHRK